MKHTIKILALCAVLICLLTVSAFAANDGAGTVTGDSVNLRTEATTNSAVIASISKGSPVVVIDRAGSDWYRIWVNGSEGYMSADYIDFAESMDANYGMGTIQGSTVRLRAGADTSTQILGNYNTGTQMDVIGVVGSWYKVSYNGSVGYVHSDYMALKNQKLSGSAYSGSPIVNTAYKYMGVRYVWGGTSPKGFDCSGFVYYVFGENGIKTNRTAASLYKNGTYVERANLQPGDVICFYTGGYGYIGHAGIYIGNNEFIHASSAGGKVEIDSLESNYYNNHYYGARRITG